MSWTDERVEELKKLWAEGLSASQIATRMGGVTRNAVIGKVHRLGLSGRGRPTRTARPKTVKQKPSMPRSPRSAAPVVGARTAEQLQASLDAESVRLPAAIRTALEDVSAPHFSYPDQRSAR